MSAASPNPQGPFPQPFGRYLLRERLGSGGMATVYLTLDQNLQIDVALKIPHADMVADSAGRELFHDEARAAARITARLNHPNFCRVHDVGEHGGVPYLAMQYVAGRPLTGGAAPDPWAAAELIYTVAAAMAEAHRQAVIHRDLKPSNILITAEGQPIIMDFGLALRLDTRDAHLPGPGEIIGTLEYMAPEQIRPELAPIGPACDIYSLGAILYELLTGRVPFLAADPSDLILMILLDPLEPPSRQRPKLDPVLDAICCRALARQVSARFASMDELAGALAEYLGGSEPGHIVALGDGGDTVAATVPRIQPEALRFAFAGFGERAPLVSGPQDRLFLDVGNDLRAGVIDHHHLVGATGSTATLVLTHAELVAGAVNPARRPDDPFTLVLHERPDLDGVAAAYLAAAYLATGAFPAGARTLARYADLVDEGVAGMTLANPFTLYAAYQQLVNRLARRPWSTNQQRWQECVRAGLKLLGYVVQECERLKVTPDVVDAFACPGLFVAEDRAEVHADIERYRRKLTDPASQARSVRLRLPGRFSGTVEVEGLLVRHVQDLDDPERCIFFKDWARTDAEHCRNGRGFVALSVFMAEGPRQMRRCILSVTPDSGASLRGLAALLDQAEADGRRQVFGADDRVTDPVTGLPRPPRPGYTNADPWYDGRAHGYTIVDAPRSGTFLSADEIETLFVRFGA